MSEEDLYAGERRLFWADVLMGCVIIGFAAGGFVFGAWFAVKNLVENAT